MTTGTIDYATSYFKYKTPTPIRGEPTNKALKRLKTELQANASSVESDLGGGDYGYLGLILTDIEYSSIPGTTPFVPSAFPGALIIPPDSTAIQALQLREDHLESKQRYLECKNVEKALLRHIQDALEDKYIEALVDEYTNLLTDDIPVVLNHLFTRYGKIRGDEVAQYDLEVMSNNWQPTDPLVLLTRPIEKLQKMAKQAGIPYTEQQLLEKGFQLIRNTRDFETGLTKWNNKAEGDKTWSNFKLHFQQAQQNLKDVRGPTMQQSGYHHANALADQIRTELQTKFQHRDTEIMSMLQSISDNSTITESTTPKQTESINITTQQNTQLEIIHLLHEM